MNPERHEKLRNKVNKVQNRHINLRSIIRSEHHSTKEKGLAVVQIYPVSAYLRFLDWRDRQAMIVDFAKQQREDKLDKIRATRPEIVSQRTRYGDIVIDKKNEAAVLDSLDAIIIAEVVQIEIEGGAEPKPENPDVN